jgi:hypothetical protein
MSYVIVGAICLGLGFGLGRGYLKDIIAWVKKKRAA